MNFDANLFDPARLPERDEGIVFHPDLDQFDTAVTEGEEGYYDFTALKAAGWEIARVHLEDEEEKYPEAWDAYYEAGDPDLSKWNPAPPEGEGWRLALISDSEDLGPTAVFLKGPMA